MRVFVGALVVLIIAFCWCIDLRCFVGTRIIYIIPLIFFFFKVSLSIMWTFAVTVRSNCWEKGQLKQHTNKTTIKTTTTKSHFLYVRIWVSDSVSFVCACWFIRDTPFGEPRTDWRIVWARTRKLTRRWRSTRACLARVTGPIGGPRTPACLKEQYLLP